MIHPTTISTSIPSQEMGRQIMSLRYDLLLQVLKGMENEARRQSYHDAQLGRKKLSERLANVTQLLGSVNHHMEHVERICSPYIEAEKMLHVPQQHKVPGYSEVKTSFTIYKIQV